MKIHSGLDSWARVGEGPIVASLGNYDGVHRGHQLILRKAVDRARALDVPAVVVTFHPEPRKVLQPEAAPPLIQTLEQRLRSFEDLGLDHAIVVPFNLQLASRTPEQFVQETLVERLRVVEFVVGENFRFGHQKQGDLSLLKQLGEEKGFSVFGIAVLQENGDRISSTLIRRLIAEGAVEYAARMLGRPFMLTGRVVEGERLGGKLGIPTANLQFENELTPARGVYVTYACWNGEARSSVSNVGIRPTVGGNKLTVEAHVLHFARDLYGARMELQFLSRLREEKKFSNVEELKNQIQEDIRSAELYFSRLA